LLCSGPLSGVLECQSHWQRACWPSSLGAGDLARGELLPFRASSPRRLLHHVPLYRVCRGISPSWKCGHLGAMGQLMMAGSASWWALALFWTAERSPGVSESLVKDALAVFSRRWRSSTGRAPELLMAGSASWWALALFWTAERCPGVSESWAKGAVS